MKLRTQLLPIALCVLIGSFATAPVDASCLAGACVLAGEDNFDGTSVYTSKWEFMIGDGCSYNLCGWGNKNKVFAPGQVLMPVRYRGEFMPPPIIACRSGVTA